MIINGMPSMIVLFVNGKLWKELTSKEHFYSLHRFRRHGIVSYALGVSSKCSCKIYDPILPQLNWGSANFDMKQVIFAFDKEITDNENFRVFRFELNDPEVHIGYDKELFYTPKEKINV